MPSPRPSSAPSSTTRPEPTVALQHEGRAVGLAFDGAANTIEPALSHDSRAPVEDGALARCSLRTIPPEPNPLQLTPLHGRTVVHLVEDDRALAGGRVVGIRENLATGQRDELVSLAPVPFEDAELEVENDELVIFSRYWHTALDGRPCPGRVWAHVRAGLAQGENIANAWLDAWTRDAEELRDRCQFCGRATLERIDSEGTTYARDRCKNVRCSHCAVRIVGHDWQKRVRKQATADQLRGDDWLFGTLTLNPKQWADERWMPYQHPGTALMAQRAIGTMFADLVETLRQTWPDLEAFRTIETHESDWPHVHVLFRGSIQRDALSEALARIPDRLQGRTWSDVAAYSRDQTQRQRAGDLRVARCPFAALRKKVRALAIEHGFGEVFDLRPVDPEGLAELDGDLIPYFFKGPCTFIDDRRLVDQGADIARELAKPSQRAARLLARGVRCFEATRRGKHGPGFLCDAPRDDNERAEDVTHIRRIDAPLHLVHAVLQALNAGVAGELIVPDFSGAIPERGTKRPRVLEAFSAGAVSYVDTLREVLELEEARGSPLLRLRRRPGD